MSRFAVCLKRDLQCLRPEASFLVLIHRPNVAGMKGRVVLAQPVNRTPDLWCEALYTSTQSYSAVSTGFLPTWTTWSVTDWRRVIFSDESRFSLSADDHRTCLEAHRPAVRSGIYCRAAYSNFTRCESVGSNFWDTRSSLVVLQGTLTARRYVDDILTPIVLPMLSSRPGAIYQQDNARPHTARLSQQCSQGYDVLPWPARSPDFRQ
ncbi:DDE_3 domain-containing protein [Trichonephila clavipes]|nr:DDE_3 domain-containing protein [Trichonephila clavipes]